MSAFHKIISVFCVIAQCWEFDVCGNLIYQKALDNDAIPSKVAINEYSRSSSSNVDKNNKPFHRHSEEYPRFHFVKCITENRPGFERRRHHWRANKRNPEVDTICKQRHNKRQNSSGTKSRLATDERPRSSKKEQRFTPYHHKLGYEMENRTNFMERVPRNGDNCTTIAAFLSEKANLNFIRRKTKQLACRNGKLARMFLALDEIGQVDLRYESHRARAARKWKHLACRLYQKFLACLGARSANEIPIPSDGTRDDGDVTRQISHEDRSTHTRRGSEEAVHVYNSSRVDFLNFMIGYDTEYTDDYQMWFY